MTRTGLLEALKKLCENAVSNFSLPTAIQKGDEVQIFRPPELHKMRLPKSSQAKKYAPYIIVQFVNGIDNQHSGSRSESNSTVRFVFCVYSENEEEGALQLMTVMDSVRIKLLKSVIIDDKYRLDIEQGLETLIYSDDTAPYYAGEMIGTFWSPPIEREVSHIHGRIN